MEEKEKKILLEEMQNIYLNFYKDLIPKVFDFNEKILKDEIKKVPPAYHVDCLEDTSRPWLEFDKEAVRCAYLLRYSVLNTISLAEHFFDAITYGSDMLDKFITEDTIKIVCLGGGSGSELVGISKTISDFLNQCEEDIKSDPLQIRFTILDKYEDWQTWIMCLVKQLRCESSICCKRKVDIRLRFFAVDLISKWNENTVKAVEKADILTMVKLMSAYSESMSEKKYDQKSDLKLLSKIAQTMKLGARIFFLDYAGGGYYHKVEKHFTKYQFLEKVNTNLHQSHEISLCFKVLKTCAPREMIRKRNTKLSSCLWLKRIPETKFIKRKVKFKKENENKKEKLPKYFDLQQKILEDFPLIFNNEQENDFDI